MDIWQDTVTTLSSTSQNTKSGLGRSIVGAAVAGTAGAIVGASTGKKERIGTTSSTNATILCIVLSQNPTCTYEIPLSSPNDANVIIDAIRPIEGLSAPSKTKDLASELRELKALMDEGIISSAEFEAKKQQLLGL